MTSCYRFLKVNGLGNDYLVLSEEEVAGVASPGAFARRVCDRHFGAGGDGVALVGRLDESSAFSVRIFNPDGSEASLSGNGTRCAAAYVRHEALSSSDTLRLRTASGWVVYRLRSRPSEAGFLFESELGRPELEAASIPMLVDDPLGRVVDRPIEVEGTILRATALRFGNPNCCFFVEAFDSLDWQRLGRAVESHPLFPDRTNVVFVRVVDRGRLEIRLWERGVGVTLASGTCACAALVASVLGGLADRTAVVESPGGRAEIDWRADGSVVLTGRADVVYRGEWLAPLAEEEHS